MNEMVERVAKAIEVALKGPAVEEGDWVGESSDDEFPLIVDGHVSSMVLARIAIEAMREPTSAMKTAAINVPRDSYWPGHKAAAHWRAMIDAALT